MSRPVWPVPFDDALRGMQTFRPTGIEPLTDLSMRCLCRAYYGSFLRAAWAMVRADVSDKWLTLRVRLGYTGEEPVR